MRLDDRLAVMAPWVPSTRICGSCCLAGLSRALYFAGEVVEAEAVAFRAVEHPEAERRPTAQAVARAIGLGWILV